MLRSSLTRRFVRRGLLYWSSQIPRRNSLHHTRGIFLHSPQQSSASLLCRSLTQYRANQVLMQSGTLRASLVFRSDVSSHASRATRSAPKSALRSHSTSSAATIDIESIRNPPYSSLSSASASLPLLRANVSLDGVRPGVTRPASSQRTVSSSPHTTRPGNGGSRLLQRRRLIPPPAPTTELSLALTEEDEYDDDEHREGEADDVVAAFAAMPYASLRQRNRNAQQNELSTNNVSELSDLDSEEGIDEDTAMSTHTVESAATADAGNSNASRVARKSVLQTARRAAELREVTSHARRSSAKVAESRPNTAVSAASESCAAVPAGIPSLLTNPFRGLHELMVRSYRLDQVLEGATSADILLARQEYKSTAFSFMRLPAVPALYEKHWAALPQLQSSYSVLLAAAASKEVADEALRDTLTQPQSKRNNAKNDGSTKANARKHHGSDADSKNLSLMMVPATNGVPGLSLFNNQLALDSVRIQSSYPMLIAQRLLLVPDHMRHFHTVCGRDGVPCDFFADVDLVGESVEEGERVLVEILNYLEVRLPGVGFTDPFFLVLANEVASADKVSYHIHARSMTFVKERAATPVMLTNRRQGMIAGSAGRGNWTTDDDDKDMADDEDDALDDVSGSDDQDDGADDDDTRTNSGPAVGKSKNMSKSASARNRHRASRANKRASAATSRARVIAFQDYRTVKLLADEVNQTLGRAVIDESCYRAHGMLRCAFSAKLNSTQDVRRRDAVNDPRKRLVPLLHARDAALQCKLDAMAAVLRTMSDPEILEMTFCTRVVEEPVMQKMAHKHVKHCFAAHRSTSAKKQRPAHDDDSTGHISANANDISKSDYLCGHGEDMADCLRATARHRVKLIRPRHICGSQSSEVREYDSYGNLVSPYLTEGAKWRRFKSVVAKLHTLPPRAAESYDVWVRVGLALHNFSNEDHVFDEWVRFSLKCPQKYSREMCRKKWVQFERNPDALNWRRGFNYINTTVWRSV